MVGILPKEGIAPLQPLTREEVDTRVRDRIVGHLQGFVTTDIDPATIGPQTSIIMDLGADSLDMVEIVMLLEEDWSIEITDDAMDRVITLGDAAQVVAEALVAAGRDIAAGRA